MSFFWAGRFSEKPSDILKHYYADEMRLPHFMEALHWWDKAQIVVLAEQKLAPDDAIRNLVKALDAMEQEGVVKAREGQWNVIHGGEEYMRKHCDEGNAGWLHLGRSSPSLRVVASRIAFRNLLVQIMANVNDLRDSLMNLAEQHLETVMPGYSYLQHIKPTTLGFYLMSWIEPLERDYRRFESCYRNTNISSVGTAEAFGIEFPIDLERLDELLGFDAAPWNARDSIRNYDYMIETYMALALMHNSIGRIAMDFLVWHTVEFGFIQAPDRLSITSSTSPQMHIPYVLEFVHGTSGLTAGRLMEALAITKTASDQLEMSTLLNSEFVKCAEESRYAIAAMCDLLGGMKVFKERMAQVANDYSSQVGAFIEYAIREKGMAYRTAHQVLAKLMQRVAATHTRPADIPVEWVEQAAIEYTGKGIGITQATLTEIFDAMYSVRQRKYRGGTAPERVVEHIAHARARLAEDRVSLVKLSDGIVRAENKLTGAFADLKTRVLAA
jgi:argininosuccinate lyase